MKNNSITIYGLLDPNGSVRYVGRTKHRLYIRLNQHIANARKKNSKHPRAVWIRELLSKEQRPTITHLETVPEGEQVRAETRWMARFDGLVNSGTAAQGGTRSYIVLWTKELDARLGVESDKLIADELGVTRKAVSYRRKVLGIPASYNRARNTPPPAMGGHNRIALSEWVIDLLGSMPDKKLADKAGVSKKTIIRARHARGIESYASRTGETGQFKPGCFPIRWLNELRL